MINNFFRTLGLLFFGLLSLSLFLSAIVAFIAGFFGGILGFIVGLVVAIILFRLGAASFGSFDEIQRQMSKESEQIRKTRDWKSMAARLTHDGWDFELLTLEDASIQRGNVNYKVNLPGARKLLGDQVAEREWPTIQVTHHSPESIRAARQAETVRSEVTRQRAQRIRLEMARKYSPEEIENQILVRMRKMLPKGEYSWSDPSGEEPEALRRLLLNLSSTEKDVLLIAQRHELNLDFIFEKSK